MDYEEGRQLLTKHNLTKAMWREYKIDLEPLDAPPDRIILWMLQTKKYVPAASWVITGQGAGLNWLQFKAMWRIIKEPEEANIDDVHNLFFY